MEAQSNSLHVTVDYICLMDCRGMCTKCFPRPRFLSCLPLTILSSDITAFCVFLCLPRAIGSTGLGDIVSIVTSIPSTLTPQRAPRPSPRSPFLLLKSYRDLSFPTFPKLRNRHYVGKYGNLVHRNTMLAFLGGFT